MCEGDAAKIGSGDVGSPLMSCTRGSRARRVLAFGEEVLRVRARILASVGRRGDLRRALMVEPPCVPVAPHTRIVFEMGMVKLKLSGFRKRNRVFGVVNGCFSGVAG